MALADPQSITINSVAKTLNRIKADGLKSIYATDDGVFTFTVSHQESGKRTRRMVRIDQRVVAADPLTAQNEYKSLGLYIVIDEPEYGFSDNDIWLTAAGFIAWLTQANVLKVLATQH